MTKHEHLMTEAGEFAKAVMEQYSEQNRAYLITKGPLVMVKMSDPPEVSFHAAQRLWHRIKGEACPKALMRATADLVSEGLASITASERDEVIRRQGNGWRVVVACDMNADAAAVSMFANHKEALYPVFISPGVVDAFTSH